MATDRSGRGVNRVILVAIFGFLGVAIYALVVTHHLHLSDYFERTSSLLSDGGGSGGGARGGGGAAQPRGALDLAAVTARIKSTGAFRLYDTDGDGRITRQEFDTFLDDLSDVTADDVIGVPDGAGTGSAQARQKPSEASPEGGEPKQAKPEEQQQQQQQQQDGGAASAAVGDAASAAGGGAGHCPELSKDMLQQFARDNTIMLTVCDWNIFGTMGINWVQHLKKQGITYWVVGATDSKTSEYLSSNEDRHPCFKFWEGDHDANAHGEYKYGSDHYREATWRKVTVVEKIVDWGFNVLHSDVDVIWFRDPLPYVIGPALANVDVAMSTDLISTQNDVGDEGLEVNVHQHVNFNTGVYFVKASPGGRYFMAKWAGLREKLVHDNDQTGLYQYVRGTPARQNNGLRRMELSGDPGSNIGLLSVAMLLNGYSYFIPQLHTAKKVEPLGAHMTWLPLSREGKFQRMRDGMLYNDPTEYYNGPKFLAAELDFPDSPADYNSWRDTESMIQYHLLNIDKQLVQVYRVMAIAVILNRTLILPKMQCFCYKNWFMMEQCRIPGDTVTQFPIECHFDQWLRPKVMYNYGAKIEGKDGKQPFLFREHSLLSNPNFPESTLKAQLHVRPGEQPCGGGGGGCQASHLVMDGSGVRTTTVPKLMKQNDLVGALQKYKDEPLLVLHKPMRLFGGFDDGVLKASFEAFVDRVAGNWCCRDKPFIDRGMKEKEKLAIVETLLQRDFLDDKGLEVPDPDW